MNASQLSQQILLARAIAHLAHRGQFRRDGLTPYITHPAAVAAMVPEEFQPVAWLHDVIEDTFMTLTLLLELGVAPDVVASVDAITKRKSAGESYDDYLGRVLVNPAAVAVKVADIENNLSGEPTEKARAKYAKALPLLKAKLAA